MLPPRHLAAPREVCPAPFPKRFRNQKPARLVTIPCGAQNQDYKSRGDLLMSGWKRNIRHRMIAAVWLLLLAASIVVPDARILAEDGTGGAAPVDGVVAGNSQFAWELYQKIEAAPENQGAEYLFLALQRLGRPGHDLRGQPRRYRGANGAGPAFYVVPGGPASGLRRAERAPGEDGRQSLSTEDRQRPMGAAGLSFRDRFSRSDRRVLRGRFPDR